MQMNANQTPEGVLAIQTLAMPSDTNANGDIFGGWLVSQMDLAGGIVAKQRAQSRVVTVSIHQMIFNKPVQVGDVISCYAHIEKIGRTSMTIKITVYKRQAHGDAFTQVTEGIFTYVAIDEMGKAIPVDRT